MLKQQHHYFQRTGTSAVALLIPTCYSPRSESVRTGPKNDSFVNRKNTVVFFLLQNINLLLLWRHKTFNFVRQKALKLFFFLSFFFMVLIVDKLFHVVGLFRIFSQQKFPINYMTVQLISRSLHFILCEYHFIKTFITKDH